jgi:SAM-dependent methyltransferase
MSVEEFYALFLEELKQNSNLRNYYKFLNDPVPSVVQFRKKYFCQRLEYIFNHINKSSSEIWDCGCGFGTTAIFLTLNGHSLYGNTLEYYFEQIPERIKYWEKFGDLSRLKLTYENLFDIKPEKQYDYIIAQDTLHHLEPINEALQILSNSIKQGGSLISIEENGKSFINRFKNFLKRGNKLVIEIYDEKLNKKFLLGNENLRSLKTWNNLLAENKLQIDNTTIEFVRIYTPFFYKFLSANTINRTEENFWKKSSILRDYFYFGVNFCSIKK